MTQDPDCNAEARVGLMALVLFALAVIVLFRKHIVELFG